MINVKPWAKKAPPKKILTIRLQAMGDVVITLPYLQDLRNNLPPGVKIDFLTRYETDPIPRNLILFNNIYSIGGERSLRKQFIYASLLLPKLLLKRYDIVIDLQNNILSRFIRKIIRPAAWVEFDRTSPIPAGERTKNTIEAIGLVNNKASGKLTLENDLDVKNILLNNGWDGKKNIVVLNPAGAFETRNWPIKSYASFADLWLKEFPETQFLVMGVSFIQTKSDQLKILLKNNLIDLVNKTSVAQAFAILQQANFVLSEDSGLMHMSWISRIPTFGLLGGTRPDRGQPLGDHTAFLHSSDMECGCCMQEKCKWGDTRCLTRYTPEFVFEKAKELIKKTQ